LSVRRIPIGGPAVLRGLRVNPRYREVLRPLSRRPGATPRPEVNRRIRSEEQAARGAVSISAAFGIWRREQLSALRLPEDWFGKAPWVGLGVVTLGGRLEAEVRRLCACGQGARAVVLDAWGSAFAEAAADRIDALLCREGRDLGLWGGRRRSPGYGSWPLEVQAPLLEACEAHRIGVALTEGCIMRPEKSVSFAVPILEAEPTEKTGDKCGACGAVDCSLRTE